jgi:uncharacterized membrane protein
VSTATVQVFMAAFPDETEAATALTDVRAMDRAGSIKLIDAVVLVRDTEGKVTFHEVGDPGTGTWAKRGAIAGGLAGLIFPPSLIAGALVGAAGGGVWGKIRDKGFSDKDLKQMGESLLPGTSAILAIAEDKVVDHLLEGLDGYRTIARHGLDADAAAVIVAEIEDDAPR